VSDAAATPRWASALEGLAHQLGASPDGAVIEVEPAVLHETLARLRDRAGFAMCTFVTAIDRHPAVPRFELYHQLLSLEHKERVRVCCRLPAESAPTCADLWPGASWMERECFDMFGIRFEGHPDLRRILLDDSWEGFPLLKSYAVDTPHPPYR